MADIQHLIHIHAPASRIYGALSEQAGVRAWWTAEAIVRPEVGSVAEFNFGDRTHNAMRIVSLEPDRLVAWECLEGDPEWVGTTFRFEIEETGDHCLLRFAHAGWRTASDFFSYCNTKWGYYLYSLKSFCETGVGSPFQPDA